MAKQTKTWKLGEWAKGGVITVTVTGKEILVQGKEWDFSKGSRRSSDQSGAKEWIRGTVLSTDRDANRKLSDFLCDLSTSYYADQIIKWIESKVKLEPEYGW